MTPVGTPDTQPRAQNPWAGAPDDPTSVRDHSSTTSDPRGAWPSPGGATGSAVGSPSNGWQTYPSTYPGTYSGTYPGDPTTWASPGSANTPDFASPPFAQPKSRRSGWVRFLAALVLVVVLGVMIGAGAVFALGWSGLHPAANTTASGGANSSAVTGSGTTVAASASSDTLEQSVEAAVQTAQPSVVEVDSVSGRHEAVGSGNILTTSGYIVTNDHVVRGYRTFTVTLADGSTQKAQLVGQDPQDDLAVLKIAATTSGATLHPIAVADSSKVQVGQFAIAVGNPLALGESASFGIVSAVNRTASEAPDGPAGELTGLIQTSAPLNPGNSGGALVNLQGQLIGMPTLGAIDPETGNSAEAIGYAIPSNRVVAVANQLIAAGGANAG